MKKDKGYEKTKWTIRKFASEKDFKENRPYEVKEFKHNILLNEGINELWTILCSSGGTKFDNANAYLGVGDGGLTSLTGTLTFTNGSASVTGSGTSFDTEVAAGDWIQLDADGILVKVASVESATALTLVELYSGTGGSGAGSIIKPTETGLSGSNKTYKGMDAGFPTYGTDQKAVWQATFGANDANHDWKEFTVANGNSDTAINLNRKVSDQGTKTTGQIWQLTLEIELS